MDHEYASRAGKREPAEQKLRIIWAAFCIAVLSYGVVAWVVKPVGNGIEPEILRWLSILLGMAAALQILVILLLKQLIANVSGGSYVSYCILRWALLEAIPVYGLVLRFLGASLLLFILFAVVAMVFLLVNPPNEEDRAQFSSQFR